jgi:hypothetical protein
MPKTRRLLFLALLFALAPAGHRAHAAPFCVQTNELPPQCDYVDPAECRKRAAELKGFCIAKKDEVVFQPGIGSYCVVDGSRQALCDYFDRTSCDFDARRANGVCIENIKSGEQVDPFQHDTNTLSGSTAQPEVPAGQTPQPLTAKSKARIRRLMHKN